MLEIKPNMDSGVEDILNFKTCCGNRAFDQNLEVLITNHGDAPIVVPSYFDLIGDAAPYRVKTLIPHGDQEIMPRATIAFYCQMDDIRWSRARRIVFYDNRGNEYPANLTHPQGEV